MNNILDYKWKEIENLDKEKTCLFMTAAPVEEHGLHLPVSIDIDLGEYWKNSAIQKLEKNHPEFNFISLPPLPLAAGSMKTFPGCIYIKPKSLRKIMIEFLENLAKWDIKFTVIIASHGDPLHNMAIEKACSTINKRYNTSFISPLGSMFSYKELGIDLKFPGKIKNMLEKYAEDFHAGWIETSMMLDISPEKVDPSYKEMDDVVVSEKEMINPKKYSMATAGKGHLGYPRLADLEPGRMINDSTVDYIADITEKLIKHEDVNRYSHHFLNRIPFLRMLV